MKESRYSDEQIVRILREADQGTVAEVAKKNGASEQTIYAWRKRFGEMMTDDVKRLKALESRKLTCAEHFRVMAFAQLTWRESLRDIEVTLAANAHKLYAIGLRHEVRRSTLADGNESRDWQIWADLAALLIRRARKLYIDTDLGLELTNTVYALDATTIDLCLSLFDWAIPLLLELHMYSIRTVRSRSGENALTLATSRFQIHRWMWLATTRLGLSSVNTMN